MVILVENKNKFTLLAVFAVLMLFVAFSGCIGGAVENNTTPTKVENKPTQAKPANTSEVPNKTNNTTMTNTT